MILQTVRLVAAWLGDATHGVAAQLDAMTFDDSDTAPVDPTIVDETTNAAMAHGRTSEAADGPVLGVAALPVEDATANIVTPGRDVNLRVVVIYGDKNADPADARRDGYYTLRAVWLSLRALSLEATALQRTRGPVSLVDLTELRIEPAIPESQAIDPNTYGQVVAGWMATDNLT